MLVKLLKNDYYNRGKNILFFCFVLILDSVIIHVLSGIKIEEYGSPYLLVNLIVSLCFIVMYVSLPMVMFGAVSDFGKRYFKDQGYFTHTLPVKTSVLLFSRMLADIANTIVIIVTYITMVAIIGDDFGIIRRAAEQMRYLPSSYDATAGEENLVFFMRIMLFLLGLLFFLWQYNAAYSIGHAFNNAKRIKSVLFFILIYIIEIILMSVVILPCAENILYDNDMHPLQTLKFELAFLLILEIIGIVCMGMITHYICKKRLNLE